MEPRRDGDGYGENRPQRHHTTTMTWTSPTTTTTTTTNHQGTFTNTTVSHPPQAAETGYLQPRPPTERAVSPVSSFRISQPATPPARGDPNGDYFGGAPSLTRNPCTNESSAPPPARTRSRRGSLVSRLSRRWSRDSDMSDEGRQPSIRLRRMPSAQSSQSLAEQSTAHSAGGRLRSLSQPERARLAGDGAQARRSQMGHDMALPRLTEEGNRPTLDDLGVGASETGMTPLSPSASMPMRASEVDDLEGQREGQSRPHRFRSATKRLVPGLGRRRAGSQPLDPEQRAQQRSNDEYDAALVDWLDTIDPEVQTLSTLTNVQNSLFVPDLGHWINRRPAYSLSEHQPEQRFAQQHQQDQPYRTPMIPPERYRSPSTLPGTGPVGGGENLETIESGMELGKEEPEGEVPALRRSETITSRLQESHYAALPHGHQLIGWTAEEKRELDDHVRHMLHSRRSRFKRRLKGFGQYVRRPLGFLVTLYATLITLFGLAWVLFLIGWIYVGDQQDYVVHIIDSVLVALFAVMGDGLAPFRAVDTYRLWHIVRYTRIIEKAQKGEPPRPRARLQKRNLPPEVRESMDLALAMQQSQAEAMPQRNNTSDTEAFHTLTSGNSTDQVLDHEDAKSTATDDWLGVLTQKQQYKFLHHKKKMAKSHSFYKPYETFTHHQFPLSYLIAVVLLLDAHSCLQISLGATTWGIDYHHRPFAVTTVILCVSITCNVTAGFLISRGDRKTRKKDVMNLLNRQEITGEAIEHMREKRRRKEEQGDVSGNSGEEGEGSQLKIASMAGVDNGLKPKDSKKSDESPQEGAKEQSKLVKGAKTTRKTG